jgi:hypothetical protein
MYDRIEIIPISAYESSIVQCAQFIRLVIWRPTSLPFRVQQSRVPEFLFPVSEAIEAGW